MMVVLPSTHSLLLLLAVNMEIPSASSLFKPTLVLLLSSKGMLFSVSSIVRETVVQENTNIRGASIINYCIPNGEYTLLAQCTSRNTACSLRVVRSDNLIWFTMSIPNNNAKSATLNTSVTAAPVITPSASVTTGTAGSSVTPVTLEILNPYTSLVFTPQLPSYLKYDSFTGTLSGTFPENGVYTYVISTSNPIGSAQQTIVFNIGVCSSGQVILGFTRASAQAGDYIKVSISGNMILEKTWTLPENRYSYKTCAPQGMYTVVYGTSSQNNGWPVYSQLKVVKGEDDLLGSFMLNAGETEMTKYFTLTYSLPRESMIYYLNNGGNPPANWNNDQFTPSTWNQGSKDNWGNYGQTTAYFRANFSVDDIKKYPIMEYELYLRDGYILYVNGKEVVRRNLPNGRITPQTQATSSYAEVLYRKGTISSSFMSNGNNIIALELHRAANSNSTLCMYFVEELIV